MDKFLKITIILFIIKVILLFPTHAGFGIFAEGPDQEIDPFNLFTLDTLDVFLERADREFLRENWMKIAEYGAEAAMAEWEEEALLLIDNQNSLFKAKIQIENKLTDIIEHRLTDWLIKDFFTSRDSINYTIVINGIKNSNNNYLYESVNGDIIYDEAGDPVFKKDGGFDTDHSNWKNSVKDTIQAVLFDWEDKTLSVHSEILDLIPEGKEDYFINKADSCFAFYRSGLIRELDKIFFQEEKRFVTKRLFDQFSIRKKSNQETAEAVVQDLIKKTESEINEGLFRLKTGLYFKTENAANTGDVLIDPEKWQESFRREFNRGLKKWENAEKTLLVERLEWERQAGKDFKNGERIWAEAYRKLVESRSRWENRIEDILEQGLFLWESKETEMTTAIERARDELLESINTRKGSLNNRLTNLIDMYIQSYQMKITAQTSIEYWEGLTDNSKKKTEELEYWKDIEETYLDYTEFARKELIETYGLTVNDLQNCEELNELDVIQGDIREHIYLDNFQVELIKAKALSEYWDKQYGIAEAVYNYAADESSSRPTEADTLAGYEEALVLFESAQEAYNKSLSDLESAGDSLSASQEELSIIMAGLKKKGKELEIAGIEYKTLADVFKSDNDDSFLAKIQSYYESVLTLSGFLENEEENTVNKAVEDYMLAAAKYGFEEKILLSSNILSTLVYGDAAECRIPSVLELKKNVEKIEQWKMPEHDIEAFIHSMEKIGIEPVSSPYYNILAAEYKNYTESESSKKLSSRLKILSVIHQISASAKQSLGNRLDAISFLTTRSVKEWAKTLGKEEEYTNDNDFFQLILDEQEKAKAQYLLKKGEKEREVFEFLKTTGFDLSSENWREIISVINNIDSIEEDDIVKIIAFDFLVSANMETKDIPLYADNMILELSNIIDFVKINILGSDSPDIYSHREEIRKKGKTLRDFLSGKSCFSAETFDISGLVLQEINRELESRNNRAGIIEQYKSNAVSLFPSSLNESVSGLCKILNTYNLIDEYNDNSIFFKSPSIIWSNIKNYTFEELEDWFYALRKDTDKTCHLLPFYVKNELNSYMDNLGSYIAFKAVDRESGSIDAAEQEVKNLSGWMDEINTAVRNLYNNTDKLKNLYTVLDIIKKGRNIYNSFLTDNFINSVTLEDIETRIVKTAGLQLARRINMEFENIEDAEETIWQENLEILLNDLNIENDDISLSENIIEQSKILLSDASLLAESGDTVREAVSREQKLLYTYSLWNTYDINMFINAAEGMSDSERITELFNLWTIAEHAYKNSAPETPFINDIILEAIYNNNISSYNCDNNIDKIIEDIENSVFSYDTIKRDLTAAPDFNTNNLNLFYYADILKQRLDTVMNNSVYNSQDFNNAVTAFFITYADLSVELMPDLNNFIDLYRAVYKGSSEIINVEDKKGEWAPILKDLLNISGFNSVLQSDVYKELAFADYTAAAVKKLEELEIHSGKEKYSFKDLFYALTSGEELSGEEVNLALTLSDSRTRDSVTAAYIAALTIDKNTFAEDTEDRFFGLQVEFAGLFNRISSQEEKNELINSFRDQYLLPFGVEHSGFLYSVLDKTFGKDPEERKYEFLKAAGGETIAHISDSFGFTSPGSELFLRALYAGITDNLTKNGMDIENCLNKSRWIMELTGLNFTGDARFIEDYTDTEKTKDEAASVLYSKSTGGINWFIKKLILSGRETDTLIDKYCSKEEMEILENFKTDYSSLENYLHGIDKSDTSYIKEAFKTENIKIISSNTILNRTGISSDPVYTVSFIKSGDRITKEGYLNALLILENGDNAASKPGINSIFIELFLETMHSELNAGYKTFSDLKDRLWFKEKKEYYADRIESGDKNYRAYLTEAFLETGPESLELQEGDAPELDCINICHKYSGTGSSGSVKGNEELELFNQIIKAQKNLNTGIKNAANQSLFEDKTADCFKELDWLLRITDLNSSEWEKIENNPQIEIDINLALKNEFNEKTADLENIKGSSEFLKKEIAGLGKGIEKYWVTAETKRAQLLTPLKTAVENLREEYSNLQEKCDGFLEGFKTVNDNYSVTHFEVKENSKELNNANFNLQKHEAILEYAESGYLYAESIRDEEEQKAVDPGDRLEFVIFKRDRASAAYEAIYALFENSEPEPLYNRDSAYRKMYDNYKEHYINYLVFSDINGVLNAAITEQEEIVSEKERDVEASMDRIINANNISEYPKIEWLNYFSNDFIKGDNFTEDRETWITAMRNMASNKTGFYKMLSGWGLAYGYLMLENYQEDDPLFKAMFKNPSALFTNAGEGSEILEKLDEYNISFDEYIRETGKKALNSMSIKERQLLNFYMLSDSVDSGVNFDNSYNFLKDSLTFELLNYLNKEINNKIKSKERSAENLNNAAVINYTMAMAFFWCPPASGMYLGMFGLLMILKEGEELKIKELNGLKDDITKGSYKTMDKEIPITKNTFYEKIVDYTKTDGELAEEIIKLDTIKKARTEGEQISAEDFLTAVDTAYQISGIKKGVKETDYYNVTTKFLQNNMTEDELKSCTSVSALAAMLCLKSEQISNNSGTEIENYINNKTIVWNNDYNNFNSLLNSYLEGGKDVLPDDLKDTIITVFKEPVYKGRDYLTDIYKMKKEIYEKPELVNNPAIQKIMSDLLNNQKENIENIYNGRMTHYFEVQESRWKYMQDDLLFKKTQWQDKMNAIITRGSKEWNKAFGRLEGRFKNWEKKYREEYNEKSLVWNTKHLLFQNAKKGWIEDAALNAAKTGSESVLKDLGLEAGYKIKEAESIIITDLNFELPDADTVINELTSGAMLGKLLKTGNIFNRSIENIGTELYAVPGVDFFNERSLLNVINNFMSINTDEIEKHAAIITADQAVKSLEDAREGMGKAVYKANRGFEKNISRTFGKANFFNKGDYFIRNAIIGSTVTDPVIREEQRIEGYNYYKAPEFKPGIDKKLLNSGELSADGIFALINKGVDNMGKQMDLIFGSGEERGTEIEAGNAEGSFEAEYSKKIGELFNLIESDIPEIEGFEKTISANSVAKYTVRYTRTKTFKRQPGEFGKHIGWAPELKPNPDPEDSIKDNILFEGSGELDHLIGKFLEYELRETKGWSEFNCPVYDRRIWDDTGDWFKAPSIRDVTDMGVTAAAMLTGNVWAAAALNLADDAVFAAADISNGEMTSEEAFVEFGKKALVSTSATFLGGADFSMGIDGVIGDTLSEGFKQFSTNAAAGAVDSITFDSQNGFGWDSGIFVQNTIGQQAYAGYLSGMTGAVVSGGLDKGIFGYTGELYGNAKTLNSAAAGAAGAAVTYGITGAVTFNAANLADLTGNNRMSMGLLELHLGGEEGFSMNLGTGGTDLSFGKMVSSFKGLEAYRENLNIALCGEENILENAVAMRTLYSSGFEETAGLYKELLKGETILEIVNGMEGTAQTVTENGRKIVRLNNLGSDKKNKLHAGIYLSHEAFRNGLDDGKNGQFEETIKSVFGHTVTSKQVAGTYGRYVLTGEMLTDIEKFNSAAETGRWSSFAEYVAGAYDSSADFWKLTTDGRLINDNDADLYLTNTNGEYVDKNGNVVDKKNAVKVIDTDTNSVSQALIQYVGMDKAAEMLGVNPADLGNYDDQTLKDVVGMSSDMVARLAVNGQLSFDDLSQDQQQKLMGELLLKNDGQSWEAGKGWNGDSIADFNISDNWNGYSIGFNQTMTNGEYNKFVVDIVHNRDAMSYFGSTGNQDLKEKFNGMDSSIYFKKDLDGNIISAFSVDQVQTVDNLWSSSFDATTAKHPFFGNIQGNTIAANRSFFSVFRQRSRDYNMNLFVSAYAQTLSGINIDGSGNDPQNMLGGRWLTHQRTLKDNSNKFSGLAGDGCILNTDANQFLINSTLSNWNLYGGFNMGTIIGEDWSELYRSLYAY